MPHYINGREALNRTYRQGSLKSQEKEHGRE